MINIKIKKLILCLLGASVCLSAIALERLSDSSLSNVQGQLGLTVEQSQLLNIGSLSYADDGNSLDFEGLRISSQTDINDSSSQKHVIDVTSDGSLSVQTTLNPTQIYVDAVRMNNSSGSFGNLTLNFQSVTNFMLKGKSAGGLEGSFTTGISNADMIWSTNGNTLSFNNIGFIASIDSFTLEYDAIDNTKRFTRTGLAIGMGNFDFSFLTGALSLGGVSLGELSGELALSSNLAIFAGGRDSFQGLTFHSQVSILSDPTNFVKFTDDGNSLFMGDFSGSLNLTNLTLDVESDHLAIGFDQMDGAFNAGQILIGNSSRPIGSIKLDFLFNDDVVNNRYNRIRLYPGIQQPDFSVMPSKIIIYAQNFYSGLSSTSEGLSMATQWNLANAEVSYIDDGRRVVFSGIQSYGSADTTIDVRDQKIAIGISDLKGSYNVDGLRIGNKTAPLQGGAELLLAFEVYQALDFDIDGFTEITAGGVSGGGIRIEGDYFFNNANIGLSIDENGEGIWATGVNYDVHLRDITFDVKSDGLKINRGEQWSTMDIADLRWGNKTSGRSLGRIKIERFEQNSLLAIKPGGAGEICVGASATSESTCGGAGGRWEDRGEQGMTVSLKAAFADEGSTADGTAIARNRLIWENNRKLQSNGDIRGTQMIFDNYSTNDGTGTADTNEYGLQANLNIDVYETKVLKKITGIDANGVIGNLGEELIFDGTARDTYTYVASPNTSQRAFRPLGFAVKGNVLFKEINIDAVQLKHPNAEAPQTLFYGVVIQNLDLTTNLTATPIQ
ncbi:MAG: hypothetical protein ACJAS9_003494 [Polaribacter sp.]